MKFVDRFGTVLLDVPEDADVVDFPLNVNAGPCVNLGEGLRSLNRVKVLRCKIAGQDDFNALCTLKHLEELQTYWILDLDLTALANCTGIKHLGLGGMYGADLAPLKTLANIETVRLDGQCRHLDVAGAFTRLRSLWITSNKRVSLKYLAPLSNLEVMAFVASRLSHFEVFSCFERLTALHMGNTNIESLDCLAGNTALKRLDLGMCRKLKSLDGIERLTALEDLDISELKTIPSIRPLAGLLRLRRLNMRLTTAADGDLSPLAGLGELREALIMNAYGDQPAYLARRLPHCQWTVVGGRGPFELQGVVGIHMDFERRARGASCRIDQDFTSALAVKTNHDAETRIQEMMGAKHPDMLKDLTFATTDAAFVVRSSSIEAVRAIGECINELWLAQPALAESAPVPRPAAAVVGTSLPEDAYEVLGEIAIVRDEGPEEGAFSYRIDQDLTGILGTETNDDAERRVQAALKRKHPEALKQLEFDSEGGAFVVRSPSVEAVRRVAQCIEDLANKKRARKRG